MKLNSVSWAIALSTLALTLGGCNLLTQPRVKQLIETRECRNCDLRGANLAKLDLTGVNLEGANLSGANLQGAKLGQANLSRVNLKNANLEQADLGCTALRFDMNADPNNANVNLRVDSLPETEPSPGVSIFGFNLNTSDRGATISFNMGGCANLQGATLDGATLPDGTVWQGEE